MGRRSASGKKPRKGKGRGSGSRPPVRRRRRTETRLAERFREAVLAHRFGRLATAEAGYREVLAAHAEFPGAALNYALLARSTGRLRLALDLARQAVANQPAEPSAHLTLANLLLEWERVHEAEAAYRTVLRLDPGHVDARFNLGQALLQSGEPEAAAVEFRRLMEQEPRDPHFHTGLGDALVSMGRLREAVEAHRQALALVPNEPNALTGLGLAHMDAGEFEEAARCYRRVIDDRPDRVHVWLEYSKTRRFTHSDRAEIEEATRLAQRLEEDTKPGSGPGAKCGDLYFALGKMYDDLGEYDSAFEHYRRGNEILRELRPFDPDGLDRLVETIETRFGEAWFDRVRGWGDPSARPIFIVGMPRSGTSLVEQILASHPEVHGAGELIRIPNLARRFLPADGSSGVSAAAASVPAPDLSPGPGGGSSPASEVGADAEGGIERAHVQAAARDYLDYVAARAGGRVARVTDKLPDNYHHLGFIAALFPNARIVHVRRGPADVCVSNYLVRFRHGHAYSYDLAALAHQHRAYERLMRHWGKVLPAAGVRPVREQSYEALAESLESESRALVDFCGLDWSERCLAFHRTERPVHTASGWQVRQPVYRRSVGRWRNYERHLGPLLTGLRRDGAIGRREET